MASAPSSAALERKQRLEHIQSFHLIASTMDNTLYDEDELKNINVSIEPFTLTQNECPLSALVFSSLSRATSKRTHTSKKLTIEL